MLRARIFKTKGKNSPQLLYFAHTFPDKDLKDNLFIIANTGYKGDKEFLFSHPNCIGGLVQSEENKRKLISLGKIAIIGGDVQQRTLLRCIHSVDRVFWKEYEYSYDFDFMWAGTNPQIKRTYDFLNIILKTNFSGWVFASGQIDILMQLPYKFDKIELFKNYHIFKHKNIYIDVNSLYEQGYFEHILNHTKIFISTSYHEGIFPNTFLEAWSRNIPVIINRDIKSYILTLNGIEVFLYDGLDSLIVKIDEVLKNLNFYKSKLKEFKLRYPQTNPLELNFMLHDLCKDWYISNGYNWDGHWYGFLAPYPMEIKC